MDNDPPSDLNIPLQRLLVLVLVLLLFRWKDTDPSSELTVPLHRDLTRTKCLDAGADEDELFIGTTDGDGEADDNNDTMTQ